MGIRKNSTPSPNILLLKSQKTLKTKPAVFQDGFNNSSQFELKLENMFK